MSPSLHPFYSKSPVKASHKSIPHYVTGYKYIITPSLNPLTVRFSDANVHMCHKRILQTNHTIYTYKTTY